MVKESSKVQLWISAGFGSLAVAGLVQPAQAVVGEGDVVVVR